MLKNPSQIKFPTFVVPNSLKTEKSSLFKNTVTQLLLGNSPFDTTDISRHFDRLVHPLLHWPSINERAFIHSFMQTYGIDFLTAQSLLQEHYAINKERIAKKLAHDVIRLTNPDLTYSARFGDRHLDLVRKKILMCDRILLNPNLKTLGFGGASTDPLSAGMDAFRFLKMQSDIEHKLQLHPKDSYEDVCRLLEIFSMNFAYEDLTHFIEQKKLIETPVGSFRVSQQLDLVGHKNSKIKAYVFEPVSVHHKKGVKPTAYVVFRGTVPFEQHDFTNTRGNVVSDIGPLGAGGYEILTQLFDEETAKSFEKMVLDNPLKNQFVESQISQRILSKQMQSSLLDVLKDLKKKKYQVVTSGHSLGGAMAVLSYLAFPDMVDSVIARSAPGMNPLFLHVLRDLLAHHVPLSHQKVRYYNNFGDVISGYDQPFGVVYHVSGNDPSVKHMARYDQDQLSSKTRLVKSFTRLGPLHSSLLMLAPFTFIYREAEYPVLVERVNLLESRRMVPVSQMAFKLLK